MKRLLRILSIITSIILLVGSLPNYVSAYERGSNTLSARAFWNDAPKTGTVYYEDVTERLDDIKKFYLIPGKYWNHVGGYTDGEFTTTDYPCGVTAPDGFWGNNKQYHDYEHYGYPCNEFDSGEQCYGFALLVCRGIFGTSPRSDDWEYGTLGTLAVGDFVRYNGHSFVVAEIDDNHTYMTVYECNYGTQCIIGIREGVKLSDYTGTWIDYWDIEKNFIRHCTRNSGQHRPSSQPSNYTLSLYVDGELFKNLDVPAGNSAYSLMYQDAENEHFYHSVMYECEVEAGLFDEEHNRLTGFFWFTNPESTQVFNEHTAINSDISIYAYTDPLALVDTTATDCNVSFYINGELWKTVTTKVGAFLEDPEKDHALNSMQIGGWARTPEPMGDGFDLKSDRVTGDISLYTTTGGHGIWSVLVNMNGNYREFIGMPALNFIGYGEKDYFRDYMTYPYSYVYEGPYNYGNDDLMVDGFYIDEDLTIKLEDAPDSFYYPGYYDDLNGNRYYDDYLLYYRWVTKYPYDIVYNGNGADGDTYSQSFTNGLDEKAVLANVFTRDGYTFAGWNTTADGSGTSYEEGDTVSNLGDTTLYAQWTYTGTDDIGDDTNSTGNNDTDDSGSSGSNDSGDDSGSTGNNDSGNDSGSTGNNDSSNSNTNSNVSTNATPASNHVLTPEERGYLTSTIAFGTSVSGNYELHLDRQGLLYQEVVKNFMPLGYSELQSVNILTLGIADRGLKQGFMTFKIPADAIKKERVFAVLAVDKNGLPYIYPDLDFNNDTITVQVDYEGYAFSIIYIDLPISFN